MLRRVLVISMGVLVLALPVAVAEEEVLITGPAFGTQYTVKVTGRGLPVELESRIQAILAEIDGQMSLWREDSELSRFNREESLEWFPVSAATAIVVARAIEMAEASGGAFDPTVGPLVSLWRFGPQQRIDVLPEARAIEEARERVGVDLLEVEFERPRLRKLAAGVQLDLNAIAKGYAVDRVAALLDELDPVGYMVEIGGEVRTFGTKENGSPWRIAIEQPIVGQRVSAWAIDLNNAALATSGDYRNYVDVAGQRFSHTIDPRTGRPITHHLASVSVIADDCMTADAWATALMVLGPEEGYHVAEREGLAVLLLVRDGDGFVSRTTTRFPKLIPLTSPMPEASPWSTFLLTAVVFGVAIAGMAIGVILSNRKLQGSCGGLNGLKDDRGNPLCEACTTPPEQCDEFRKQAMAETNQNKAS